MGLFSSISDSLSDALGGSSVLGVDLGGAVGDVIGGLGTALANSAGSIVSSFGQYQTNKKNLENQDYWNKVAVDLANTAHQRQRADLEAAGLNPILAVNQGSTTPSLSTATMQNPLASFGTNSKLIADAINGRTKADLKIAEADADSAKAYSDRAEELAAAELSEARARSNIAWNDAHVSEITQEADRIDALARLEALQGLRPGEVDVRVRNDKTYKDLVEQYRNEIKSGKYKSSLGRAVFQDVMSGANSASDVYRKVRNPTKPGRKIVR